MCHLCVNDPLGLRELVEPEDVLLVRMQLITV
jgi:hypothetical protein